MARKITMWSNRTLLFESTIVTLSILITCIVLSTPAMASSKGSKGGGGGPVTQEQVSTGNPTLDKEINKFYSCISKTHQDPPTIEKVDSCYYQTLSASGNGGGSTPTSSYGVTGPGANPPSHSTSASQHHKK